MRRAIVAGYVVALAATTSAIARADDDVVSAKAAYDRGLEAHRRGELHRAAEEFALADSLAPSAVALQAALDAAIGADDAALGEELVERSRREPPGPTLAASVTAAHLKFAHRTARIRVACPSEGMCIAKIDDRPLPRDRPTWVNAGSHVVSVQLEGTTQTKTIDVPAEQAIEVAPAPRGSAAPGLITRPLSADVFAVHAAAAQHREERRDRGLPPIVFYGGVGLTVVLLATTAYFASDTGDQHDSFKSAGCLRANYTSCEDLKKKGENSQTATNVAAVLTGVSAIATVVIGAAFTRWKGPVVAAYPGGGGAVWRAAF